MYNTRREFSVLKVLNARRISPKHKHMLENMLDLFVLRAFTEHLRAFKMYSLKGYSSVKTLKTSTYFRSR